MTYKIKNGRYVFSCGPGNDEVDYAVDMAAWLARAGTTLKEVTGTARGITALAPIIQGTRLVVRRTGFDARPGAVNSYTFHLVCENGAKKDATIYFER